MIAAADEQWLVVTGASSGIGRELALSLQQHGYRVIATARSRRDLDTLTSLGLTSVVLELADAASVSAAIRTIEQLCVGRLAALINNAAYAQPGAIEDLSRPNLEKQFAVNLFGVQQLTSGLLPALRRHGNSRIINISSVLGLVAFPYQGAYNASKFALEGLSDTLRLELHGSGVQVSLIEPGPIRSDFRKNALEAFRQDNDWQHSQYAEHYQRISSYYAASSHPTPFTGEPTHVVKRVLHALRAPRPKPRYYVTLPTYVLATCRRLLPDRLLDVLLRKLASQR